MFSRSAMLVLGCVFALGTAGCGGGQPEPVTAADVQPGPHPLAVLPAGGVLYARIDLGALRESPYADQVVGWYREFAPAIPDFSEDEPGVQLFEEVIARTESVAMAVFAPADEYPGTLGQEEGFVAVMRGGVDLAFVQKWAARFHLELLRNEHAGRTVLTPPDPSGEQMMVVELDEGLLGFVVGELPDSQARIESMVARLDEGATGLAAEPLVEAASAVRLSDAPFGGVLLLPPGLAEEIGEEMGSAGIFEPSIVTASKAIGLRIEPSATFVLETVALMKGPGHAQRAAARLREMTDQYADNAFVLLLGFDLWLEHTSTRVEGDSIVRSSMRIPPEDMHAWLFHVEHLAAAAKAFFVDGGGLQGLLSGFAGPAQPHAMERPPRPVEEQAQPAPPTATEEGEAVEEAEEGEAVEEAEERIE